MVLEKEKWGFNDPQDNWEDLDEIARAVRCAYSARLIQRSEAQGFNIIHTMVPYTTRDKAKTRIACYTLGTTIKKATEIYNKMIG